jgi:hypothetical protein
MIITKLDTKKEEKETQTKKKFSPRRHPSSRPHTKALLQRSD